MTDWFTGCRSTHEFTVALGLEHDVPRVLQPQHFRHRVVRILAEIADPLGEKFPRHVEAIHVSFRATVGHVAPPAGFGRTRETGEIRHHLALEVLRVERNVRAAERIADIVRAELEEGRQRRIVELLVARITDEITLKFPQSAHEGVELALIVWLKLRCAHGQRVRPLWVGEAVRHKAEIDLEGMCREILENRVRNWTEYHIR